MKTLNNLLSLVGILLLMTTLMAVSCRKEPVTPPAPSKPVITSFTVASVTSSSVTFNFSVSNYTSLRLSIDGKVIDVSGGTFVVSGLNAGKSYTATLTASNADGSISSSQSFSTSKSSLSITSFKVTDTAWSGASFAFASSSDANITSQTLINNNTSISIDVSGKGGENVEGLMPDSLYTFTFKVKDDTQNEVSQSISFRTKKKVSEFIGITSITYDSVFAIIGNAVSSKLRIKVNAEKMMSLSSLTASFGEYGSAVKMLRYSLNGAPWVILKAEAGKINFKNVLLASGENTFDCYFSLKANVGVANGAPLSFSFISMNDGEGGGLPKGGSFPSAISIGSVDALTQPTIITSNWNGFMYANTIWMPAKAEGLTGIYQIIALKATGPTGARIESIRLKNPYAYHDSLIFGYKGIWSILSDPQNISQSYNTFLRQDEYFKLILPKENYINGIVSNGNVLNNYYLASYLYNQSSKDFFSGIATPDRMGFALTSKYDIVIKNSSNQIVDISDVKAFQDYVEIIN